MMVSQLLIILDKLLEQILHALLIVVIIMATAYVVVSLFRSKEARPVMFFIFCLVWTLSGAFFSFECYNYYSSKSQVYGTPQVHDPYEDFNYYEYDIGKSIAWYTETSETGEINYFYRIKYATTIDFDGTQNKYNMIINNTPCDNTQSAYGKIQGSLSLKFFDTDFNQIDQIDITVRLTFYSSEIELKVDTNATSATIPVLNEYVAINGFNIRIIDQVYGGD